MRMTGSIFIVVLFASLFGLKATPAAAANPKVEFTTTLGNFTLELYPDKAPKTVDNILFYVKSGYYNGTIFHRVIPGFMIQGGGFLPGMKEKGAKREPVVNEADNGLKNVRGAAAMARTSEPDSASSQFFVNTVDNEFLNHTGKTPQGWGYCVFGQVVAGLETVDKIKAVETGSSGMFQDVPKSDVTIASAKLLEESAAPTAPATPVAPLAAGTTPVEAGTIPVEAK